MEKKAKRQGEFPTLEHASSSGNSDSDGDANESDNYIMRDTLLTRKRKCPPPANTVSHKRHSRTSKTISKQRLERAAHSAERQKLSSFRGRPLSSRLPVPKPASGAQFDSSDDSSEGSGNRDWRLRSNERPKSIASLDCSRRLESIRRSRSNTEGPFPSSTHTPPNATGETRPRPSVKGILLRQPDIAIYPLSTDIAFLAALFRGHGDMETFSISQAAKHLENVVGYFMKLDNVTVKPLTSGIWFVTSLLYYPSDTAGGRIDKPAPAFPSLPATGADPLYLRDDDRSSGDDVGDESSSDYDDNNGDDKGHPRNDDDDERLSNNDDEHLSFRKHSRWSQEDDDRLRKWKKEEGRPWDRIYSQFPSRSAGAVQARWYTKLREKA